MKSERFLNCSNISTLDFTVEKLANSFNLFILNLKVLNSFFYINTIGTKR